MKTLQNWYTQQTEKNKLIFDSFQMGILQQFDLFITNFIKQNFFTKLFNKIFKKNFHYGYYIYGSVGRGKSMILNQFYKTIPIKEKIRLHFHQFMNEIHKELSIFNKQKDPLKIIAKQFKKKYKIIFLDEMHVSDIATAMILKKLFEKLFENGIYIVTNSNYHPDNLYSSGLMRERFLPAIELIKNKLNIISLDNTNDYRLLDQSINELFFIKHSFAREKLNNIFNNIRKTQPYTENSSLKVLGRSINYIKKSDNIIWLDFKIICGDNRSQLDYLYLIKKFNWFIISNIYPLNSSEMNVARRFTWLIDILYDNKCKLAISSEVPINEIYLNGEFINEFNRTISRLNEMKTIKYLS